MGKQVFDTVSARNRFDSTPQGSWYRQGWAWFLLTPLIVIILVMAGFITAAVKWSDDVVIDNYYREGRMYNERLEQDQRAAAWKMQADLSFDLETGEAFLTLQGDDVPPSLVLLVQHPTEADLDQVLTFASTGQGHYRADIEKSLHFKRYLQLFAGQSAMDRVDATWRLKSEIDFEVSAQSVMVPRDVAQPPAAH